MKQIRYIPFLLGLMGVILASTAYADYDITFFKNSSGKKYSLSGWDGKSQLIQLGSAIYTISASDVNTSTGAKFVLNMAQTGGTPNPSTISYNVVDNNIYGPIAGNTFLKTSVSGFSGKDSITATGDFAPTDLSPDTSVQAKSSGPTSATAAVNANQTFNFGFLIGTVTFGSLNQTLTATAEVYVNAVPEPASMAVALLGIPCMGGLVRLARRKR